MRIRQLQILGMTWICALPEIASAAENVFVSPWQIESSFNRCSMARNVVPAGTGRALDVELLWTANARLQFRVLPPYESWSSEPASAPEVFARARDGGRWSVKAKHPDGVSVSFEYPGDGRVTAAMFDACVDAQQNPRPLSKAAQDQITWGPEQAPRAMRAMESVRGCHMGGTFLEARVLKVSYDILRDGDFFTVGYEPGFGNLQSRLRLDLSALGGPRATLEQDIRFQIPPAQARALRADVLAGKPRMISVLEKNKVRAQLGWGMMVNQPVVRMFEACVATRGL
jgi:hypothetical protein